MTLRWLNHCLLFVHASSASCVAVYTQGPVVQSFGSLTKLLGKVSLKLTLLTKSITVIFFPRLTLLTKSIVVIFFPEKLCGAFALQKLRTIFQGNICTAKAPHIFSAKNGSVFTCNMSKLNILLTNNVVSFTQLGPLLHVVCMHM